MLRKNERRLARKIVVGLASAMLGFVPFGIADAADGAAPPAPTELPKNASGADVTAGNVVINELPQDVVTELGKNTDNAPKAIMDITQTTDKAVINWTDFNVGKDAQVNFIHLTEDRAALNTEASTLNRVTGENLSQIAGTINSVGTFILVNPNGAIFYENSEVNAAGIIVSTEDMGKDQEHYLDGKMIFSQDNKTNNNIIMNGTMRAEIGTDTTTESGANKVLSHLSKLEKIHSEQSDIKAAEKATEAQKSAAQAKLTAIEKVLGSSPVLNITKLTPATGFAVNANGIKLIADGDIVVGTKGSLLATAKTEKSGDTTVGVEEFELDGTSTTRTGSVVLRADQNADDVAAYDARVLAAAGVSEVQTYDAEGKPVTVSDDIPHGDRKTAKVYLNNAAKEQIQSQRIGVYYDADIVGDIGGTAVTAVGVNSGAADSNFTQKNYNEKATADYKKNNPSLNYADKVMTAGEGDKSTTFAMLVNNIYQLRAIDHNTYGNRSGSYALGRTISADATKNWNGGAGFTPIAKDGAAFSGSFTGNGGSNGYGIYDLNINMPEFSNVALFARVNGGSVWSTSLIDAKIVGKSYVGGIAGEARNAWFEGITVRKRVSGLETEPTSTAGVANIKGGSADGDIAVGGVVGAMAYSTIRYSTNAATVEGRKYTGGLVGFAVGKRGAATIEHSGNTAYLSTMGNEKETAVSNGYGFVKGSMNYTGGLVGFLTDATDATITANGIWSNLAVRANADGSENTGAKQGIIAESWNNGQIQGGNYTGGLVGQLYGRVDASGNLTTAVRNSYNMNEREALGSTAVITEESTGAGTGVYGKVIGKDNVGGVVGYINTGIIDTVYNAGNVAGNNNVGGLAGGMKDGKITKAYNADNNTILQTAAPDAENQFAKENESYYGFTANVDGVEKSFVYKQSTQEWSDGTKIYKTQELLEKVPESERTYNNRIAYRDATVMGSSNVGGLVGNIEGGSVSYAYNAGKVTGKDESATNVGAVGGTLAAGATIENTFFVTNRQASEINLSGVTTAFGDGTSKGVSAKTLYEATNNSTVTPNGVDWLKSKDADNHEITVNQDEKNWMIYSNSSTPLLKAFMTRLNINRQYEYDGTTHNLVTSDVSNFYGGAFFAGEGKGIYVHSDAEGLKVVKDYKAADWKIKTGSASKEDINETSSIYTYENADMWSPQHGYYIDPDAAVIITPRTLKIDITGSKTYGQNAVSGAVIVPTDATAADISAAHNNGTSYAMQFLEEKGADGKPVNGLVNGETAYGDHAVLKFDGAALSDAAVAGVSYKADSACLEVGEEPYTEKTTLKKDGKTAESAKFANPVITSDHNNYKITITDTLTVDKATLYYTAEGVREYGETNNASGTDDIKGHITFRAIDVNNDNAADAIQNGALKLKDKAKANDLSGLDGFKNNAATNMTLVAAEAAKNGTASTDTKITEKTWVRTDGNKKTEAYILGKGSFENGGNSQLESRNYKLVFVDNAAAGDLHTDAQKNAQGTSKYTITPVELKYNITGSHTYGDDAVAQTYTVEAAEAGKLKLHESISDIVEKQELDELAKTAIENAEITVDSHVQRDASGKVTYYYDKHVDSSNWKNDVKGKTDNYTLVAENLQYTVKAASLKYTAGDKEKIYGETTLVNDGEYTGSFEGFKKGETETSAYHADEAANVTAPKFDIIKTADGKDVLSEAADAGEYTGTIKASGLKFNDYDVTYVNGKVTVTARPINIKYEVADASKVYGEENPNGAMKTVTAAGADSVADKAGFIGKYSPDATKYKFTGMPEKMADADTYDKVIDANMTKEEWQMAVGKNYKVIDVALADGDNSKGTMTIERRALSFKVDDATNQYGDKADISTVKGSFGTVAGDRPSGLVEGQTLDITGITYQTTTNSTTDAGTHADAISIDEADWEAILGKNYKLDVTKDLKNGTMTITPRKVRYVVDNAERIYGDTNPSFTGAIAEGGLVNGKELGAVTHSTDATRLSNVTADGYAVTADKEAIQSQLGSNYEVIEVQQGTLKITPKKVKVRYTVKDSEKIYGEVNPDFAGEGELEGIITEDKDKVTGDFSRVSFTDVPGQYAGVTKDGYAIGASADWASVINSGNYVIDAEHDVTVETGTLKVTPREVTFKVNDAERVYGDLNPKFSGEFGGVEGDSTTGIVHNDEAKLNFTNIKYGIKDESGKVLEAQGLESRQMNVKRNAEGEVVSYNGVVTTEGTDWSTVLGPNYKVTEREGVAPVTAGNLTITPRTIAYKADDQQREVGADNPTLTGGFVRADGKSGTGVVNSGVMDWDKDKVETLPPEDFFTTKTTKESPVGRYVEDIQTTTTREASIALFKDENVRNNYVIEDIQYGTMTITPIGKRPYTPKTSAVPELIPDEPSAAPVDIPTASDLDVSKKSVNERRRETVADTEPNVPLRPTDAEEEQLDAEKDTIWQEVVKENKEKLEENGGEIDRERRGSLRFLTIEDTGINLRPAAIASNSITIDASSRADGGSKIVIGGKGGDVRVAGTKPLLKGTTLDTLKETAVIRLDSEGHKFMSLAGWSEVARMEVLAMAAAAGGAPVLEEEEEALAE